MKKPKRTGPPRVLADCEPGEVVKVELLVTGQIGAATLVRLTHVPSFGPLALPPYVTVEPVSAPSYSNAVGTEVDPVRGDS